MPTRLRPLVTACLLAGITFLLSVYDFRSAPLSTNEAMFAARAQQVEGTPLFFRVADDRWLQPAAVYAAVPLRGAGAGDHAGRLASAIVGAINVALVFVAARLLVGRDLLALLTALMLMVTPGHWWYARLGTDAIFPVPFLLLWLIGMLRFLQFDSAAAIGGAGLALGLGVYTHPVAPLTMTGLWMMTVASLVVAGRASIRNVVTLAGGFAVAWVPATLWFVMHPDTYADTFGRWALLKAHARFPLDGLRAQVNWNTLSNRASIFWGYLDPSFLFFKDGSKAIAPLLLFSFVLVPVGLLRAATFMQPATRLLLFSAALVPVAIASTFGQAQDLSMAVMMPAAAALLAGVGVDGLASHSRAVMWSAILAGAASAYQLIAAW